MESDGKITFDNLNQIFKIGNKFVARTFDNQLVGGFVHNTRVEKGAFGEKYFKVTGLFTMSNGNEFVQNEKTFTIDEFKGLKRIDDLNVRPMTDNEYNFLKKRGDNFVKFCFGTKYLAYSSKMFKQSFWGPVYFNAKGRVMVDPIGFKNMNPNLDRHYHQQKIVCNPDIPEDLRFMTWPYVHGFSFVAKQWGEMYVEHLDEIKFDDNAFDQLVLDPEYKDMAKALVTNAHLAFTDIITGKSGGCIFLLHGPPGCGKTLMTEAIAELLHRPLYSITVGELGTCAEVLERKLLTILEIANSWNSVILIDEADVFLEKRTMNDIERNAMVGIFLRLLERHQGVMFLTTNRADCFDEAFRSRISVIIKFDELNQESRYQIWKNLLHVAKIMFDDQTLLKLSEFKINGRQIKNAIRMAQCLALNKKVPVNFDHMSKVIAMM